jgi:hypothetical protein
MQLPSLETLTRQIESQTSDPPERLAAAVAASGELHALGEDLVGRFVGQSRQAGCSWAQIGGVLGVTKQAAQQRYPAVTPGWPPAFREDAQRALAAAGAHAQRLGHPFLGTEHVQLALAEQDDSLAGHVLADLDVTPARVEAWITERTRPAAPTSSTIGVSGRVKRALDHARREGPRLGQRCPGAEHLLLALAADTDGAAARILGELEVTPPRLRDALAVRLGPDADELVALLTRTRPRHRLRRR